MAQLFGRNNECELIDGDIRWIKSELPKGQSRAIVFHGQAGIGKTRMLEYAFESAWKELKTADENRSGIPYSATLHQDAKTPYCINLHPKISPDNLPDCQFIWLASRYGNPAYRQHVSISLADALSDGANQIFAAKEFEENSGRLAGISILKSALKIAGFFSVPFASAAEAVVSVVEDGKSIVEAVAANITSKNIKDSPEGLGDLNKKKLLDAIQDMRKHFPVVIAVDNIHWAKSDSDINLLIDLLNDDPPKPGQYPLLLLFTIEDSTYFDAQRTPESALCKLIERVTTTIPLSTLDHDDSLKLVESISGASKHSEEIEEAVKTWARGYPLRLVELGIYIHTAGPKRPNLAYLKAAPNDSKQLVWQRVTHIPESARLFALLSALLSSGDEPMDSELTHRLCAPESAPDALAELMHLAIATSQETRYQFTLPDYADIICRAFRNTYRQALQSLVLRIVPISHVAWKKYGSGYRLTLSFGSEKTPFEQRMHDNDHLQAGLATMIDDIVSDAFSLNPSNALIEINSRESLERFYELISLWASCVALLCDRKIQSTGLLLEAEAFWNARITLIAKIFKTRHDDIEYYAQQGVPLGSPALSNGLPAWLSLIAFSYDFLGYRRYSASFAIDNGSPEFYRIVAAVHGVAVPLFNQIFGPDNPQEIALIAAAYAEAVRISLVSATASGATAYSTDQRCELIVTAFTFNQHWANVYLDQMLNGAGVEDYAHIDRNAPPIRYLLSTQVKRDEFFPSPEKPSES
jgi:hypothetical protein